MSNKTVTITVLVLTGQKDVGQHILDLYTKAVPVMEDLIGVPFPPTYPIKIQEYLRADIGGVSGRNQGIDGLQIADSNINYDPTLLHEFAHYWFASPRYEKWIFEGFATLYSDLALRSLGDVKTADQYRNSRFADYQKFQGALDIPLSEWKTQTGDLSTFAYGKASVFLYTLYDKAGRESLKQINKEAFITATSKMTSTSFLPSLSAASGQDFSYLGPGWIFPGIQQPFK